MRSSWKSKIYLSPVLGSVSTIKGTARCLVPRSLQKRKASIYVGSKFYTTRLRKIMGFSYLRSFVQYKKNFNSIKLKFLKK